MRKTIVIMAAILIVFVLAGSLVLHFGGSVGQAKFTHDELWRAPMGGGESETLKAIDLTGDGEDEVFAQTPGQVAIFSAGGEELLRQDVTSAKSTMGDFDGDGVDEFAVAEPEGSGLKVAAYTVDGTRLWESSVPGVGQPSRGQSVDFEGDGQREVIFGTDAGAVVVLGGRTGELRWVHQFPADTQENLLVRGTDDALYGGRTYLAAAVYGGEVVLLDGSGATVWEIEFPQQVRRLRTGDMDGDGTSEILLGGLEGLVWLASAADGSALWTSSIGSRVNEARFLELDGDPSQTEVAVGGKNGGVFAYNLAGETLWKRSVTGKVLEFNTLDHDGDGQNELLVAADGLSLHQGSSGRQLATFPAGQPTTLDVGDFGKDGAFLVGSGKGVQALQVGYQASSWWSSPIVFGLVLAAIIAVVAVVLSRSRWATAKTTYTVQEMSLEALRARKKMLREVLEETQRMKESGEITPDAYLVQSRGLREQMADVDAKILELQPDYKPEVIQCSSCAAPLEIGLDRCPYCGHVLL
jgi:outer membrane protein assembly factor BamB